MQTVAGIERKELIEMADMLAKEKGIDKEIVLEAMEAAVEKTAKNKYGAEHDIRATLDRKTGAITIKRHRLVVEEIKAPVELDEDMMEAEAPANDSVDAEAGGEDEAVLTVAAQITLEDAKEIDENHKIGDYVVDELPPVDFGRVSAQGARQIIINRVRDAERQRQYEEFKERKGEIVNGTVKRIEYGSVIVDLGRTEALLHRDETIPREHLGQGDRIRALILDVRREQRGPQIFLSRSHPEFMVKLFHQEVPEIYDGVIQVKSAARDPGSRAKIAVSTNDSGIDPIGACVGMRGSRVQAIVNELQGEKIDIVPWSENLATFVVNGLAPAEVLKVVVDEENNRLEVVVPDDQLSLAIGRRGQNVRLASKLAHCEIDITTEADESERRSKDIETRSKLFIEALDVDDVLARLLVAEGFMNVEDIAYVAPGEIESIEGLDEDIANELRTRAKEYLDNVSKELEAKRAELGVADDVAALANMTPEILGKIGAAGVKTLDDLGDLATDELIEIIGESALTEEKASDMIMAARAHWFADEDGGEEK